MKILTAARTALVIAAIIALFTGHAGAQLRAIERIHGFGHVGIDFDMFHNFKLTNDGSEAVTIDSVIVNCDCTSLYFTDSTLQPGDTGDVRIQFNTRKFFGETSRAVRVYWRGENPVLMELFFTATVGQWHYDLKPKPLSLFFLPNKKSKKVKISNPTFTEVQLAGIEQADSFFTVREITASAKQGEAIEFEVTPSDNLSAGTYMSSFTVMLDLSLDLAPVHLTIPVKIVRY